MILLIFIGWKYITWQSSFSDFKAYKISHDLAVSTKFGVVN